MAYNSWYDLIREIGLMLKCLPSNLPDGNEHIVRTVKAKVERIEKLESSLKALLAHVGASVVCHDWCEANKHEDDPTPNPYCDCGACDLLDRANEASRLMDELCTCTPSKHYAYCNEDEKCQCGNHPKHEEGCESLAPSQKEKPCPHGCVSGIVPHGTENYKTDFPCPVCSK